MALQVKKIKLDSGIELQNSYFKIDYVSYNDRDCLLYFTGSFYINEQCRREKGSPISGIDISDSMVLSDKTVNIYRFIYDYIKNSAKNVESDMDKEVIISEGKVEEQDKKIEEARLLKINKYSIFKDAIDC